MSRRFRSSISLMLALEGGGAAAILRSMLHSPKQVAFAALKFLIPAAIIGYLLGWHIQPSQWETLTQQPKHPGLLLAALLVAVAAISLSFARWCLLVRAQGIELQMREAFRLGSICYLLNFVSAGSVGGDLFKAVFLARRRPGKGIEAVASVLVDRGSGLYGLLLLVTITLLFSSGSAATEPAEGSGDIGYIQAATTVFAAAGTALILVLVFGGRAVDRALRAIGTLPLVGKAIERIGGPLRMFHQRPFAFVAGVLMSIGVQATLALSVYLIARGLFETPPTLVEHFIIVPIAMLASALPISPAGLGVFEAAMETLYHLVPRTEPAASGTLVALAFEVVKVVMAGLGTVFYWTADDEVRHSLEIAEEKAEHGEHSQG